MNSKDVLSKLQLSVPKRCLTRWTNVYDIAYFVVKHYDKITEFLQDPETYSLSTLQDVISQIHNQCYG